ncbi:MAG: DUF2474 domain-containing protein [Alphaproteobacteria bacterium]|nr:DUF2474 domain-containing protein [Alphaproteobacteria bacterium]
MRNEPWRRVLWFIGLWGAGVAALTLVATVLRLTISAVGY